MRVKVLCVGDVVGTPGRRVLTDSLPQITAAHDLACVIVNAENVASGSGITPELYNKLLKAGVSVITLGDHVYRRPEIIPIMETSERMTKPANLPVAAPGREFTIFETAAGPKVAVFSLLGRMFIKTPSDCPFRAAERVLARIPREVRIIVVDVHAEATSEKIAMGWFLDGKVSLIFGTHTHVPTADERILPGGTGYITDVGMTGPFDSVLGRNKDSVIQSMMTSVPQRLEVADGDPRVCGVIAEISADSGRCTAIERICVRAAAP